MIQSKDSKYLLKALVTRLIPGMLLLGIGVPIEVNASTPPLADFQKVVGHDEELALYFAAFRRGFQRRMMEKRGTPNEAFEFFRKRAATADREAEGILGMLYATGFGVERDTGKAMELLRKAAPGKDHEFSIGWALLVLLEKKSDTLGAEAARLLADAVKENHGGACGLLAYMNASGAGVPQDRAVALRLFQKGIDLKSDDAIWLMSCCHRKGLLGPPDSLEAARLRRQAAEMGHPAAQFSLACSLEKDSATQREAFQWMQKASESPLAAAISCLAGYYIQGIGVKKDINQAVRLYQHAANDGSSDAKVMLALLCFNLKQPESGITWARAADAAGNPGGAFALGLAYDAGQGVKKDSEIACAWFRKSATQGTWMAQYCLGNLLVFGRKDFLKKPDEGFAWMRKAAEQGYHRAQCELGYFYAHGLGTAKSDEEAVKWYRRAVNEENPEACAYLAYHLRRGRGCPKDMKEALRLFEKSIAPGDDSAVRGLLLLAQLNFEGDEGVPREPLRAIKLLHRASDLGSDEANFVLITQSPRGFEPYEPDWMGRVPLPSPPGKTK
jgi:TPR repeat protein